MSEQRIIGIYSFPKSGNTWIRQIFASLLGVDKGDLPAFVPDVHQGEILENLTPFGNYNYFLYKSHTDVELRNFKGRKVANDLIIHIRRHPLDVFVSYLNFISNNVTGDAPIPFESVDSIVGTDLFSAYFMNFVISGTLQPSFKPAGSWFQSNKYWVSRAGEAGTPRVHSIMYENLIENGSTELEFLSKYMEIDISEIDSAMSEADSRTKADGKFFWKRKSENFREFLSSEQIDFFWRVRGDDARRIGYFEA